MESAAFEMFAPMSKVSVVVAVPAVMKTGVLVADADCLRKNSDGLAYAAVENAPTARIANAAATGKYFFIRGY